MSLTYSLKSLFFNILIFSLSCCFTGCAKENNDAKHILGDTQQNIWNYIQPNILQNNIINQTEQTKSAENYLQHYFSPWTHQNTLYNNNYIKNKELSKLQQFEKDPGFGENRQHYAQTWINQINHNIDLEKLGKHDRKAIVVDAADLRVLPTVDPSYSSPTKAGQFYPFDNLQESFVSIGTPALILQSTQDGAWDLILIHNDFGWIQHQHIAYVDDSFIHQWQAMPYGVITTDHSPIYIHQQFAFFGRMGSIYPISSKNAEFNNIKIPIRNLQQQAVLASATVDKTKITLFPLVLSVKNIATLSQSLVGNPYGWGGMYGYRDCSSTMVDLFAPFGVWLPRNSGEQIKLGKFISLKNLSREQKREIISKQGIPFLTLIGLPGHIMLYIGTYHGEPYVLQEVWGLRTGMPYLPFLGESRAVLGQTVITPLDFDYYFINVPTKFIDKITGVVIL